jgi:hypothetical protein
VFAVLTSNTTPIVRGRRLEIGPEADLAPISP